MYDRFYKISLCDQELTSGLKFYESFILPTIEAATYDIIKYGDNVEHPVISSQKRVLKIFISPQLNTSEISKICCLFLNFRKKIFIKKRHE